MYMYMYNYSNHDMWYTGQVEKSKKFHSIYDSSSFHNEIRLFEMNTSILF